VVRASSLLGLSGLASAFVAGAVVAKFGRHRQSAREIEPHQQAHQCRAHCDRGLEGITQPSAQAAGLAWLVERLPAQVRLLQCETCAHRDPNGS